MNIKLVATDLDDTLLRDDLTLSERVIEAIRQAREQGVYVTFATGRMPASARLYAEQLGLDVPIITYNGAMIQEAISRKILYRKVIPVALAREVIGFLLREKVHFHMYREDRVFVQEMNEWSQAYGQKIRVTVEEADLMTILEEEKEGVEKIIAFGSPEELAELRQKLCRELPDRLHLTSSKPYFLEMNHQEVNKGNTLLTFAEGLGIKREEVMAIGDSLNDMEMIRCAGLGVAMANALQEVKDAADVVTASNEEDGVAKAIEEYVLS
ncbi:Cof-type HAD-IIB family hydrolase [Desulfitobacterium sp. PCE1]|uniref:Cof-type HAD-IIB family hydrolase n=1 Tax=Desulfitobacterium sp. PCE1 TaxID=146907 RepID=UPI00036A0074|nr:Cof-type HAD-IIB family hydrolase [Desulfitobacterium sp. PCE1]